MERGYGLLRVFQAQAFPSWRSGGAFGRGAQRGAASKPEGSPGETGFGACGPRLKAENRGLDGKAAERDGMLVRGGADVR
jgi:hypothetical protein